MSDEAPLTAPSDAASSSATPSDTTASDTAPKDTTACDTAPKDSTASDTAPKDSTASDTAPSSESKAVDTRPTGRVIELMGHASVRTWVRRKIVVFRRLEPGDARAEGSLPVEESPYLEATLVELALPKRTHDAMRELATARATALESPAQLLRSYEPAGFLFASGAGGLVGVWLDYLPSAFRTALLVTMVLGVVAGFATRIAKKRADAEALRRWSEHPRRREYDELARELAESWTSAQAELKRSLGLYTVIRVAEGSTDPLRLASIDPRPYAMTPPIFDPDDFLPSLDAGPVRYELVHATGEVVTQALTGTSDVEDATAKAP